VLQKKSRIIQAHDHPVSQICLSEDGTRLATTSERGTKVRLFDTATCNALQEFTRGSYGATISSISFNSQATILILTSNTGTIHLFSCEPTEPQSSGFGLWVSPNYWRGTTKSISQFSIPNETFANGTILKSDQNGYPTIIIVLGASGAYYKYSYVTGQPSCTQIVYQHFFKNGTAL